MTNMQRIKNDFATIDRREKADRILSENRDRNDSLTQEKRFVADETMRKNRERNDDITADRRDRNDLKEMRWGTALSVFLLTTIILVAGIYTLSMWAL